MTSKRTILPEKRREIVEHCITHNNDCRNTAALYGISYNQVYAWMKKYLAEGEVGLEDKRGCRKTDAEINDAERRRREKLRLKHRREEQKMVVELLKKAKKSERM